MRRLGFHSLIVLAFTRWVGMSPGAVRRGLVATLAPYAAQDNVSAENQFLLTTTSGGGGTATNSFVVTSGTTSNFYCPDAMEGYPLQDFEIVIGGDGVLGASDVVEGSVRVGGVRNGITVDFPIIGGRCLVRLAGEAVPAWHSGMTIGVMVSGAGAVNYRMEVFGDSWFSGNEGFDTAMDDLVATGEAETPGLAATMDRFDKQAGFQGLHEGVAPVASLDAARSKRHYGRRQQGSLAGAIGDRVQGLSSLFGGNRTPVRR